MTRRWRVRLLERAATAEIGPRERDNLIGLAAPDYDREHVLNVLRRVVAMREQWHGAEAAALLAGLTEPPPEHQDRKVT